MVWGEPPASLASRLPTPQTHVVVCKDGGGGGLPGPLFHRLSRLILLKPR